MRLKRVGTIGPLVFVLTGCGITAIKPYVAAPPRRSQLNSLTVRVIGRDPAEVAWATELLRQTAVFKTVTDGSHSIDDLTATVVSTHRGIKCGTPQMMTMFTLGLVPTGNVYMASLELEFTANGSEPPLKVESRVAAHTMHGLWAFPIRASKRWIKLDGALDATNLSGLLRDELLERESALAALAKRRAA